MDHAVCGLDVVLFDFGGVLADEGFADGLREIGRQNGLDPDIFFEEARLLVHETGYVTGRCGEGAYWQALRERTGVTGRDAELRREILSRFVLRPWMLDVVDQARNAGLKTGILSDQTNWLDELDGKHDFFRHFDVIFNSFHAGRSKLETSWFPEVIAEIKVAPGRILFIDDNSGNCERAGLAGIKTIRYTSREAFLAQLAGHCPVKK